MTGAFRRKRGVREASDLLRVALSYGFCGLSFDRASAWAQANESAKLCKAAVIRRLYGCGDWLEGLLREKLASREPCATYGGLRLRLVDATRVSPPACKGAAWRIHTCFEPLTRQLCQVSITDRAGGEHLNRFKVQPGELFIGDRSYGTRPGIDHVVRHGGHFLVRSTWHHTPLNTMNGEPFKLFERLRELRDGKPGDFDAQVAPDKRNGIKAVPCRVVAVRKPLEAAQEARKRVLAEAKKKGTKVKDETLEACGYFFVVTSLPREEFDADSVLALYALRWQVEIEFKRLKSLFQLNNLRAKKPETVRVALTAKILGAVLVEELAMSQAQHRTSSWSLCHMLYDAARQAILGFSAAIRILTDNAARKVLPPDDTRKRQAQCLALVPICT